MAKQLMSEKQIKKALKIKDWKNLPLDMYDDLAQLLVTTKKDVALGIINQLPDYMSYAKEMIIQLTGVCEKVMASGDKAHQNTVAGYMTILNGLQHELDTKRMTGWRRRKITKQMMEIAEKIAEEGKEHKKFVLDVFKTFGQIGLAIGTLALTTVLVVKDVIKK